MKRTDGRTGSCRGGAQVLVAALIVLLSAGSPIALAPVLSAQTADSIFAAAQRAAHAWRAHDFDGLLEHCPAVALHLPGADPSAPLPSAQAAELLRAFAGTAREVSVAVEVARDVDSLRAYAEVRRVYLVRRGSEPRTQTLYLGLRRSGEGYAVAEIRLVR